ncbi:restriction endonuclease subunit S [Chryseobacterium sp.]|uniref:restriction endonuclease subunit S n=1 Tax=Chryseobacterium sp. TaxID=1871047 RepID=UPI002FC76CE9
MNNENTLIPELRFPEFIDDGDWEKLVVSQVASYENGKAHEQNIIEDGAYIVVNSKFISSDGKVRKYTDNANCLANKDDVLMVLSDVPNGKAIAKCFYVEENNKFTVNQRVCKITATDINSKILYYVLNRNSYLLSFDDGVKQTNLRNEDVLNCPVVLPKNPREQTKISEFISSLDEVIEAHTQRLELLNDHKKGLLQNLFPQKGEIMPKYRFSQFSTSSKWIKKRFSELFEIGNGRDYKHLEEGEVPVYGSGGYMLSVDDYLYNGESVCIGRKGTIDKPLFLQGKFWTVDTLFYTHSFKNCLPKYIFYVFENINWKNYNEAGGVPSLSKNNIYDIEVFVPKTIDEQQKIASCLSALDELIIAQTKKIYQLRLHKKGLMQSLFPKMND